MKMRQLLLVVVVVSSAACTSGGPVVVTTVSRTTGVPIDGVRVKVGDASFVTTGADGKATFDGISRPYTVTVDEPQRPDVCSGAFADYHSIYVLQNRTESEVAVEVEGSTCGWFGWRGSVVSGTVTGLSGAASSRTLVGCGYKDWDGGVDADGDGSFRTGVPWQGPAAVDLTFHAWEGDGARPPGHYYGFGSTTVSLVDQVDAAGVSIALQPVTEQTIDVSVSAPSGLTATDGFMVVALDYGDYERQPLGSTYPWAPGSFSVVAPSVAGAETWIEMGALGPEGYSNQRRRLVPSSNVPFVLPSLPQALEPADGATLRNSTAFKWKGGDGTGRSTLSVSCDAGAAGWIIYSIETDRLEATIPDVSGVTLPSRASCDWVVIWHPDTDASQEERTSQTHHRTATTS